MSGGGGCKVFYYGVMFLFFYLGGVMLKVSDVGSDFYKWTGDCRNIAYLVGYVTKISKERNRFFLRQVNLDNHALPIDMESGVSVPASIKEGTPIKVTGRVMGFYDATLKTQCAKIQVLFLDTPTILDIPPDEAFLRPVPIGAPNSPPSDIPPEIGRRSDMGSQFSKQWNQVTIAGFVSSFFLERPKDLDETKTNRTLIVMIRQQGVDTRDIPVRFYSRFNEKTISKVLKRGQPLLVNGSYRMKVEVLGDIDPETGLAPVKITSYIHGYIPQLATKDVIRALPVWWHDFKDAKSTVRLDTLDAGEAMAGNEVAPLATAAIATAPAEAVVPAPLDDDDDVVFEDDLQT